MAKSRIRKEEKEKKRLTKLLHNALAGCILSEALVRAGYHKFVSHYHIGPDRVASYFNLSKSRVFSALKKGKLKGVKENGRWKIWTYDALDFVFLEELKKVLKKRKKQLSYYSKEVEILATQRAKTLVKNHR